MAEEKKNNLGTAQVTQTANAAAADTAAVKTAADTTTKTTTSSSSTAPAGWNSAWGEYQPGVNDFSTVMANKDGTYSSADQQAAEAARNAYINSQGGTYTDEAGHTYTPTNYYGGSASGSSTTPTSSGSTTGGYVADATLPPSTTVAAPTYMQDSTALVEQMQQMLDAWKQSQEEQLKLQTDYATQQGITELERAQQDAQQGFTDQRNQIAIDEARALDNQALYAEARGDKGGIGAAQYAAIQAAAATNRQTVNTAQQKLATDTARAIADLRAQGAYEAANGLLTIGQNYLSQLMSLQQWSAEYNMSVAQFNESIRQWQANYNESIRQWEAEYQQSIAQWQASYDLQLQQFQYEQDQYATQQQLAQQESLAQQGVALAEAGIMPSASQIAAMQQIYGYDSATIQNLVSAAQLSAQTSTTKSSGGDGTKKTGSMTLTTAKEMAKAGQLTDAVVETLHNAGYTDEYLESEYGYDILSGVSQDILDRIEEMSKGGSVSAFASLINKLLSDGKITESQANAIARSYGYTGL